MHENIFRIFRNRVSSLAARNFQNIYPDAVQLEAEFAISGEPLRFADRLSLNYRPIREGEVWGEAWDKAWFHLTGTVPESFAGKEVCLRVNTGSELLVYDSGGVPLCGLTNYSIFDTTWCKDRLVLPDVKPGDRIDIWCEASASGMSGIDLPGPDENNPKAPQGSFTPVVNSLKLCTFNRQVWLFLLEMETLSDLFEKFGPDDYRGRQLLEMLNCAADVYAHDPANAAAAREVLKETVFKLKAEDGALTACTIGHAHIDVGYLWPVRESTGKAARTFSSQLLLMEQYPEFKFGASQPYLYETVKENYPELFGKIRQRVQEGRWELQGGMYVEADSNLISGESMVRQFLYGKNFFRDEFGKEVRMLWLPDVFGYSAAMPQIIRKAGCDCFLTQKISWNQVNRFPHHTFRWIGVDGSSVLTHFPPEDNYNAHPEASSRIAAANRFVEGGFLPGFMSLVGIGDGGGGPSDNHVERCRILQDLRGCPKSEWVLAEDFFRRLEKSAGKLAEWHGELYLELHRGTLTTQARTKRGNRRCEQALTALEMLASCLPPDEWPREKLRRAWKTLLVNQFHDIIPGSAVREVYERTEKEHAEILSMTAAETAAVCSVLFRKNERCAVLINTLSCIWSGIVSLPASWNGHAVLDEAGSELPAHLHDGVQYVYVTVAGNSFLTLTKGRKNVPEAKTLDGLVLENDLIRYEFNSDGRLIHAYDKELKKEFLAGEGNVLSLYNDRPQQYDAWDIDIYYRRDRKASFECVSAGPVTAGRAGVSVDFVFRTDRSELRQKAVLAPGTRRLDFETRVNWQEHRTLLRTGFPLTVHSDRASYDIQYAYVERPTHDNTSWDQAKFETCGHKYADLSDRDCGAALLNDCKYGYCIKGNTLDLALLRSPRYPDRSADLGEHCFTYSFLPHAGGLPESEVMREAACLNRPVIAADGFEAGESVFPCRLESEGIRLEAVKRAEKDNSLILRLVEIRGRHSAGTLSFTRTPAEVSETDLLEWEKGCPLELRDHSLELNLKPFEILTLRAEWT